jgi:hypothetical protein
MNEEQQALQELSHNWRRKSGERLAAARRDLDEGMLEIAVSNLYYAMFYAFTGVLTIRGYKPLSKHSAVKAVFHRDFVNQGLVDLNHGRLYQQLFDDRHRADYDPVASFDQEELEELIEQVTSFISVCDQLMEKR